MLFWYLYFWIHNGLRMWFRKVYYHFEEPLPENAPVIFACTHPNSAVDYLFAPIIMKRPIHVLVRGDVFQKKWLNALFRSIWMLPVYRFRDGYSSLNKNVDSFNACFDLFDKKGRVLIFSEGTTVQRKELQPLQKGTARLALDYLARGTGREIFIVPMVNNYTHFRTFRATVMTNFGKPIKASSYMAIYGENTNHAYTKLTGDIHTALGEMMIQPADPGDDGLAERALNTMRLAQRDERKTWLVADHAPFLREKALVDAINQNRWKPEGAWLEKTRALNVSHQNESLLAGANSVIYQWLVLVALAPFVVVAQVFHFVPYRFSAWVVRTKIKDAIFANTVMVLGSTVIYMVQWWLIFAVLTSTFGWWGVVASVSILCLSLVFTEIIDDYRFALLNRTKLKVRKTYRELYEGLGSAL